jgi:nitroreductase
MRLPLVGCLAAAVAAPSVYNTQPWRFGVCARGVEVFADHGRRLLVADPDGRELLISVGAAIFNLRVAIRGAGRVPVVRLLPAGASWLAARLDLGAARPPTVTVRRLVEAIWQRRTSRWPFVSAAPPARVLEEFAAAAATEGAVLVVARPEQRDRILAAAAAAEVRRRADAAFCDELAAWTAPGAAKRRYDPPDGIPAEAFGPVDVNGRVVLRDFALGHPEFRPRGRQFEPDPLIAVLSTRADTPDDWLRAGQALERVWLTATVRGVSVTPITGPVQVPELRAEVARAGGATWPQVVIRLGYGRAGPRSLRRRLSDMLVSDER